MASALLLGTTGTVSGAQSVGRMLADDLRHAGGDVWAVIISPVNGSSRDWLTAGGVLAAGAAISPFDDEVDRWAVRDSSSRFFAALKPFRKGGAFFQGNRLVPVAAGVLIAGYATGNQDLRDGVFGCAAAWGANNQLRHQLLYRFINRRRPDPYKDDELDTPPAQHGDQYDFALSTGDTSWGHNSFPGGHVANLATCSSFLNHRFNMGAAEPVLYALAAAVGVGRIADRAHWMSDQVVGTVFGYAIGREVALRQRRRVERARQEGTAVVTEIPRTSRQGFYIIRDPERGTGLGWQRSF